MPWVTLDAVGDNATFTGKLLPIAICVAVPLMVWPRMPFLHSRDQINRGGKAPFKFSGRSSLLNHDISIPSLFKPLQM